MFYINTLDNSVFHGPGGQTNAAFPEDADACFAKLVSGSDLIDRMARIPVSKPNGVDGIKLQRPVVIQHLRMVSV